MVVWELCSCTAINHQYTKQSVCSYADILKAISRVCRCVFFNPASLFSFQLFCAFHRLPIHFKMLNTFCEIYNWICIKFLAEDSTSISKTYLVCMGNECSLFILFSQNAWSVLPKQWLMCPLIQSCFHSWLQILKSQLNIVIIQL